MSKHPLHNSKDTPGAAVPESAFLFAGVRPRLGEFDLGGVLYHARYFHIYEDAREACLEEVGCPYPTLVQDDMHLAVVEAHQQFLGPVVYGIAISVSLWIEDLRRSSFTVHYAFHSASGEKCLHLAWTKHVVVQKSDSGFKTRKLPVLLEEGLRRFSPSQP